MTGPRSEAYTPPQFDSVEQILDSLIMREALDTLRMAHRQVLRLAYDRDLTQSQIAERLGLPLAAFQVHLRDCAECQSAVAEFESMARALKSPAPAVEPPPDLEAKVVASVQQAVLTARQAGKAPAIVRLRRATLAAKRGQRTPEPAPTRMSRWWHWHWNFPVFSLAAALGAAAAAVLAVVVVQPGHTAAPAVAGTVIPLRAQVASRGRARHRRGGRPARRGPLERLT